MKPFRTILSLSLLILLTASAFGQSAKVADKYYNDANKKIKAGKDKEAVELFRKAAEAELASPKPRKERLQELGILFASAGVSSQTESKDFTGALWCYELALPIYQKLGNDTVLAALNNYMGSAHFALQHFDKAISFFTTAANGYAALVDGPSTAQALQNLGVSYQKNGENQNAITVLGQSLELSTRLESDNMSRISYNLTGELYKTLGRFDEALHVHQEALALARKLAMEDQIPIHLNNVGLVFYAQTKYDSAAIYLEKALSLARSSHNDTMVETVLSSLATVYQGQGKYDVAISSLNAALDVAKKRGDESTVGAYLNILGQAYKGQGHYADAWHVTSEALTIARNLEQPEQVALRLNNLGEIDYQLSKYDSAMILLKEAMAILEHTQQPEVIAAANNNIAQVSQAQGRYEEAIAYMEKGLAAARTMGQPANIAISLSNLGLAYNSMGQYEKAITSFQQALDIVRELKQNTNEAIYLNNIGTSYHGWGRYDKAIQYFKEALAIAEQLHQEGTIPITYLNIGNVYKSWGQWEQALKMFEQALALDTKLGKETNLAKDLSNIGVVYMEWGQFDRAREQFEKAYAITQRLGLEGDGAGYLNNIGTTYQVQKQYAKAIQYFERALAIDRKLNQPDGITLRMNNIGLAYGQQGDYPKGLKYLLEALALNRKLGREGDAALLLPNIAAGYYYQGRYAEAVNYFVEAVDVNERLRRTATGEARRDYLANVISTYQALTSTYIRMKDVPRAFATIELSKAKSLSEQIAGSDSLGRVPSLQTIQRSLPAGTAVLVFTNTNWKEPVMTEIVITPNSVVGFEVPDSVFCAGMVRKYEQEIDRVKEEERRRTTAAGADHEKEGQSDLEDIINVYRTALQRGALASRGVAVETSGEMSPEQLAGRSEKMGRELYDHLLKPASRYLEGMKQVIIVPDGALGVIPFEALIGEDGKYVGEKFDVRYTQSLGVLSLIQQRKYPDARKPMIAFGGAIYDETMYASDMVENGQQLAALGNEVEAAIASRGSVRTAYTALGVGKWGNLPGTLAEVNAIAGLVKGVDLVTGENVSEPRVKKLSSSNQLAGYKVLHFATHGLVVPELPDLSALVLCQFKQERDGEDGYLRMGEISELKLKADFVNLSACETGLGKIYGGEGVVGLTQAFLLAGANGLSVSLWQVADASTSKFMVGMYGLVEKNGMSYPSAIAEMKRKFIKGDFGEACKAPYFWAPFVYFGK